MPRAVGLTGERGQELLLVLGAAQIALGLLMALADEREGRGAVQNLASLLEVGAGLLVLQVPVETHPYAADRVDEVHEAREADLRVMVDPQTGVVLDGAGEHLGAAHRERGVELVLRGAEVLTGPGTGEAGHGQPGVTRQAHHGRAVRAGVQKDHRVGTPATG